MATKNNSSDSFFEFIGKNFGVLLLITLFFIAGFMGGSLWKENQLLKSGQTDKNQVEPAQEKQPQANEPQGWTQDEVISLAADLDLDQEEFTTCLQEDRYVDEIKEEIQGGQAVGVGGTPATILVVNGQAKKFISGAVPMQQLTSALDSFIENPNQEAETSQVFKPEGFVALDDDDHYRGNPDAEIVLVEYSDYECPFCTRFQTTMQQVIADYGDQVAWVYRHYPLPQLHPNAIMLANASECATELGGSDAFWELSDVLLAE